MKQVAIRITDEQYQTLEAVAKAYGMSKTRLITTMVESGYDKLNGNPKMREALEKFKEITEFMKGMGTEIKP